MASTSQVDASDESIIESSGLFDSEWYLTKYAEAGNAADAIAHFCDEGAAAGCWPNPYFDTAWYASTYGEEFEPGENPLVHYIRLGERENTWPSEDFDPEWYRDTYQIAEDESPLRHYLTNCADGSVNPLPSFDAGAYVAANPEAAGQDPYLHSQNRQPAAATADLTMDRILQMVGGNVADGTPPASVTWDALQEVLQLFIPLLPFDEQWYLDSNADIADAVENGHFVSAHEHFISHGFFEGRTPVPPAADA